MTLFEINNLIKTLKSDNLKIAREKLTDLHGYTWSESVAYVADGLTQELSRRYKQWGLEIK